MTTPNTVDALPATFDEWARSKGFKLQGYSSDNVDTLRECWEASARALAAIPATPKRCPYCDDTGDVHSIDGEWRGRCTCPAGQQAGGVPAGWRPIESAPKDGTEVLVWRDDCGQFIALYTSPDAFPMTQDELDKCEEDWLFQQDWFTQWPQAMRLEGSEVPTHWMPLPADPGAAPSPSAVQPLSEVQIEAAAEKLAERMDYPWTYMTDEGRAALREAAKAVIEAGIVTPKEPT